MAPTSPGPDFDAQYQQAKSKCGWSIRLGCLSFLSFDPVVDAIGPPGHSQADHSRDPLHAMQFRGLR